MHDPSLYLVTISVIFCTWIGLGADFGLDEELDDLGMI